MSATRRDAAHTLLDAVTVFDGGYDLTAVSLACERLVREDRTIDSDALIMASLFLIDFLLSALADGSDRADNIWKLHEVIDRDFLSMEDVDSDGGGSPG